MNWSQLGHLARLVVQHNRSPGSMPSMLYILPTLQYGAAVWSGSMERQYGAVSVPVLAARQPKTGPTVLFCACAQ